MLCPSGIILVPRVYLCFDITYVYDQTASTGLIFLFSVTSDLAAISILSSYSSYLCFTWPLPLLAGHFPTLILYNSLRLSTTHLPCFMHAWVSSPYFLTIPVPLDSVRYCALVDSFPWSLMLPLTRLDSYISDSMYVVYKTPCKGHSRFRLGLL